MIKKRKKIKNSKGGLIAVFLAVLPLLLFVYWLYEEVLAVNADKKIHSLANMPNYYQLCQSNDLLVEMNKIKEGLIPEQIVVELAGINLPVLPVSLQEGTWAVNEKVANYAMGTSLINAESGNVGIYGHDNIFSFIKQLKVDDEIFIFTKDYKIIYKVEDSIVSDPSDVDIFYPTEHPTLTLVTCEGVLSQKRFALKAKFDKIVQLNCHE